MKPLRESSRPALRQCAGKIAAEATRWWLGCGDDSQEQRGAELILQMHDVVDCADSLGPCVKCDKTVSVAKFLHNFFAYKHLVKPWQYPPRLRMLLYISASLGSSHRGSAFYILSSLGSSHRGLAFYILSSLGSIHRGLGF